MSNYPTIGFKTPEARRDMARILRITEAQAEAWMNRRGIRALPYFGRDRSEFDQYMQYRANDGGRFADVFYHLACARFHSQRDILSLNDRALAAKHLEWAALARRKGMVRQ